MMGKKKKSIIVGFSSLVIVILIIIACSICVSGVKEGTYQMTASEENATFFPWIQLENSEFQFYFDSYSSYIYSGRYRIKGKQLILECDNNSEQKFYFTIDGDKLVFDENKSSQFEQELKSGVNGKLEDGVVFERRK